jgi:hypothetical protein
MKMRNIKSSILFLLASALVMVSCQKEDVVQDVATLGQGSYVKLESQGNTIINATDPAGSTVSQTVSQYGAEQEKVTIYVSIGAASNDKATWKKIKDVTIGADGQYTLNVTGSEIATAIAPTALTPGQVYTLYNQITTKDGQIFDITNTFAEFAGLPTYAMALTWSAIVVCPFVPTDFAGQFVVVQDTWGDYVPGEEVEVTAADANGLDLVAYPSEFYGAVNRKAIRVVINPQTGAATVTNQVYGDYPQFGLINMNVTTVGTANYVFSCAGTITLRMRHRDGSGGDQGTYTLRLRKK